MKKILLFLFTINVLLSCKTALPIQTEIYTSDIDNFWNAYDRIRETNDTLAQAKLLKELYLDKGTTGLNAIIDARNYTSKDYLHAINNYPKFWNSIRDNTLKAKTLSEKLEIGIDKLRNVYPDLKSASVYFTIGALRTNGTTMDSLVLIGSELAMGDRTQ